MNKQWSAILWVIESVARLKTESPTFFKWWFGIGAATLLIALTIYILHFYKVPLPGFVLWLNDGWFTGFGSGVMLTSGLTVKNNSITTNKEKKLPLTAKKDGLD